MPRLAEARLSSLQHVHGESSQQNSKGQFYELGAEYWRISERLGISEPFFGRSLVRLVSAILHGIESLKDASRGERKVQALSAPNSSQFIRI